MGALDRFLNTLRLNPDDDDYDTDEYEIQDDEPEEKYSKKSSYRDNDVDDYVEPERKKPVQKVTPMKQQSRKAMGNNSMEVCVIKPNSIDDTKEITDTLLSNRTVVLNLEGTDLDLAQRIIDFTSGSAYAIQGNLQKISQSIFIITPSCVDISGDYQDLVGSYELPTRK